MAKNNYPTAFTPAGRLAYAYIAKADTEAPAGASFKPDGKFKGTLVLDADADIEPLRAQCIELLRAEFGSKLPDESELALPIKSGDGHRNEEFHGFTLVSAASQYQPTIFDGQPKEVPKGVFPYSGDKVRFKVSLYPFKKTEKVREKGKMIDVDLYGVSLRLLAVQIIEKGQAGGGQGGFDAVEGGYEASEDDVRQPRGEAEPKRERKTERQTGDDADF